jgi:predicted dehydrogenase
MIGISTFTPFLLDDMNGMGKVSFGVVGTSAIADKIIAAGKLDPRFEVSAVYSRTAERAAEFADKHSIPLRFTSLEEMTAGDVVDTVYIASPNALHAEQTIACLRAGKHVLCEKPFAANSRQACAMIDAARQSGRLLMEAMKPTLTPNFRAIMDYLPKIGRVRGYFAAFGKYSSRYDRYKSGELPNAFNPELANGALLDIGVYAIYPMVVLFGRPESTKATLVKLPSGVDGCGAVSFSYGEMIASTLYSKVSDLSLPFEIEGEEGSIRGDAIHTITHIEYRPRGGEWRDITIPDHSGDDYSYEISHFIDLVQSGQTSSPINTLASSLITMELMDEVRRQGKVVYPTDTMPNPRLRNI